MLPRWMTYLLAALPLLFTPLLGARTAGAQLADVHITFV